MKTPVEVLEAAFAALNIDDWSGFADLCDPVSLRAFKTETLDFHVDDDDRYEVEADDLIESEPDMPRAVAEYQAARMNQVMDPARKLSREFLTIKSVEEVWETDPAKLFVLWLQACSPCRRLEVEGLEEEPWEADAAWDPPVTDGRKATRGYRYSVIGSVTDGPDIAHVIYRTDHGVDKIFPKEYSEWIERKPADEQELARQLHHHSDLQFVTCRRQSDGSWRLIANRELRLISSRQWNGPEPKADC